MVSNLSELLAQKEALDREIRHLQTTARAEAIAKIRGLMSEFGLVTSDLVDARTKPSVRTGSKVQAKYRDPDTGQSWTGRGLKPRWLTAALASGKSLSDFTV